MEGRVLVEVAPVVELGIGLAQEELIEAARVAREALAQLGVALVEPDDRSRALVELDHVTELVGQDAVEVVRREPGSRGVHVDHLALRGELVDPRRQLVRRREVPRGAPRDPRDEDVDTRIAVDAGRPFRTVRCPVGGVDLRLERRRRGLHRGEVDGDAVLDPPLGVIGQDAQGRAHPHVLLGVEVVRPELRLAPDGLVGRRLPRSGEGCRRRAVAAAQPPGQVEEVRRRQRVAGERVGHVLRRRARRGCRRRRGDAGRRHDEGDDGERGPPQHRT